MKGWMAGLFLHRHFPNFSLFFFFLPDSFVSSYEFFWSFSRGLKSSAFAPRHPSHLCLSLRYPSDPLDPFLWFTHLPLRLLSDRPTVYRCIPVYLHHSLRGTCRECGDRINTHFHWLSHRWIVGRPEWPRLKGPPGRMVSEFDSSQKFLSGLLLMYKA